jgi:AcrR family transcriptional regulator
MPRTRSRPKTEGKFLNAVLELVANEGCCALGVNAVAHKAGADKVLIYRYFGNLNGLLQRVAESREWLPTVSEIFNSLSLTEGHDATDALHKVARLLTQHIQADKTTHQLVCWRKADKNPLTDYFSNEWKALWRELPGSLSIGLDYETREAWKRVCALMALIIEAELCDEPLDSSCFQLLAKDIRIGQLPEGESARIDDDQLPTNLL